MNLSHLQITFFSFLNNIKSVRNIQAWQKEWVWVLKDENSQLNGRIFI